MKREREKVITILRFYRDVDKTIKLNERVIKNLEDQYYTTLGAVNMDGMPHGKGTPSSPVERVVLNVPASVQQTISSMNQENRKLAEIKGHILSELNGLLHRRPTMGTDFGTPELQPAAMPQYTRRRAGRFGKAVQPEQGDFAVSFPGKIRLPPIA